MLTFTTFIAIAFGLALYFALCLYIVKPRTDAAHKEQKEFEEALIKEEKLIDLIPEIMPLLTDEELKDELKKRAEKKFETVRELKKKWAKRDKNRNIND